MSSKKRIQSSHAPAAIGPYSQAIAWGKLLFCSGQIPLIPESMQLETADISVQTRRVLSNLKAVLESGGSSADRVVKTTVFLTDLKNFESFNKEYETFLKAEGVMVPPARSTIQISALPKGAMVEVEAIAMTD